MIKKRYDYIYSRFSDFKEWIVDTETGDECLRLSDAARLLNRLNEENKALKEVVQKNIDIANEAVEEKRKLEIKVSELEDKSWYEACLRQLKEQNEDLVEKNEELRKENISLKDKLEKSVQSQWYIDIDKLKVNEVVQDLIDKEVIKKYYGVKGGKNE